MTGKDAAAPGAVEHLGTAECWRLLERNSLGRLAVEGSGGVPDVFPVNFTVHSGAIYLRSAPGSKLMDIAARPGVAFEIDGEDPLFHWSVVIKGSARRLDSDDEIHASGVESLVSASPTLKEDYIAITPSSVTGRRFRKNAEKERPPASAAAGTGAHEPQRPPEDPGQHPTATGPAPAHTDERRPHPIPHYPPRHT
jgi:nitroimidazol reductase NimA-like FMN-containing flavoprotein (pyridoxamine 5'-phosphate oxidase superfamily)